MASEDPSFVYRLPVTFVRIVGERRLTTSQFQDENPVTTRESVVTTELGADPLTAIRVVVDAGALTSQQATWTLRTDGRLAGSDVATTVEPLAGWKTAIQIGALVAGAGVALAGGPPGWAGALAIAALSVRAEAAATAAAAGQKRMLFGSPADGSELATVDPAAVGVRPEYVQEHEVAARTLAAYRVALLTAGTAHAQTALSLGGTDTADVGKRLRDLARGLVLIGRAAAVSEATYAAWLESRRTTVITPVNERTRVDALPSSAELRAWAKGAGSGGEWANLAMSQRIVVSVDLEMLAEDTNRAERRRAGEPFSPPAVRHSLWHRPPRPATITVWRLVLEATKKTYTLEPREVTRLLVSYAGNEVELNLASGDGATSRAVAASFDENGALTKLTTETIDERLQRARDLAALPDAIKTGASTGAEIGKIFARPTLTQQAAEAKAAAELGLIPKAADPLRDLRGQLEEARLRAQLKIAEQIATSSSPLTIVVRSTETDADPALA